jgi:hypothetical protein
MITMRESDQSTKLGANIGAIAGIGAGLVANKAIKITPKTNFVTEQQAQIALKKTAKDVFQLNTKGNIIEKAEGTLENAKEIAKASTKGLENLAKRYNLSFNEKSTADTVLDELRTKSDLAMTTFVKKIKTARKLNFVAAGMVALGVAGAVIGKIAGKAQKAE